MSRCRLVQYSQHAAVNHWCLVIWHNRLHDVLCIAFIYIIFFSHLLVGFILCHGILNTDATSLNLWKLALQSSSCLSLYRDEVFHIHKAAEDLFVNIRGYVPDEITCWYFYELIEIQALMIFLTS